MWHFCRHVLNAFSDTCIPANTYLLRANDMNARKRYRTCSKFTIKIPERRQWHWTYLTLFSSVFIVHFKQVIVCWTGSIFLVPLHNPSTSWSWFFWIDIVEKRKKYGRNFCSKLDLSVKMLKKNYKKLICLLLLHFSHH